MWYDIGVKNWNVFFSVRMEKSVSHDVSNTWQYRMIERHIEALRNFSHLYKQSQKSTQTTLNEKHAGELIEACMCVHCLLAAIHHIYHECMKSQHFCEMKPISDQKWWPLSVSLLI